MHETSGVLRPAVLAYFAGGIMTDGEVAAMRAYLRQWIDAPAWQGEDVQELRDAIDGLTSRERIDAWLLAADRVGIDPL
jgi:DNA transposition AAA+ family ATPase